MTLSNENCLIPIILLRNSGNEKVKCIVLVLWWNFWVTNVYILLVNRKANGGK